MKRILMPTSSPSDWQRLLAQPRLHWKPRASAMTAAACWEASAPALPAEIIEVLNSASVPGLRDLELICAIPEWEVALEGGETTSNTDVLAICRNDIGLVVLGVEAKVLEDFGPRLSRKRAESSPGQASRLEYLHKLLGVDRFEDNVRYQLLHRTASALLTARQFHADNAVMLVHAFGTPAERRTDFDNFALGLNCTRLTAQCYHVRSQVHPSLHLVWCNGNPEFLDAKLPSCPEFAQP